MSLPVPAVELSVFDVERTLRQRFGSPISETRYILAFSLSDGRQIAVEREGSRPQIWLEAKSGIEPVGVRLVEYAPNKGRNSNLPPRLAHVMRQGYQPRRVFKVLVESAGQLEGVLSWYQADIVDPLLALQTRFLEEFPDFVASGSFAATAGRYWEHYRVFVDELLSQVAALQANGPHILSSLINASRQRSRGARPPFFDGDVIWRVSQAQEAEPEVFNASLTDLIANADKPAEAVDAFNGRFWPLLRSISDQEQPARDTRVVPSTLLALVRPNTAISVRYQSYFNAYRMLEGGSLFGFGVMTGLEYERALALAWRIRSAMDAWGWAPRDFWDVHIFVLVTCASRTEAVAPSLPDLGRTSRSNPLKREPMNRILYGPPGTGKTFSSMRHAVAMIDGDEWLNGERHGFEEVRSRYGELLAAKQIEFVTFHQSYAYEDFVEGLRPTFNSQESGAGQQSTERSNASGGFELKAIPGVFHRISTRAEQARQAANHPVPSTEGTFSLDSRRVFKMSIGRAGSEDYMFDDAIENSYAALGYGGDLDWSDPHYREYENVRMRWHEIEPGVSGNVGNIAQVWRFLDMAIGDLILVSQGNSAFRAIGEVVGDYRFEPEHVDTYKHRRSVRWLVVPKEPIPSSEIYNRSLRQASCYRLADEHLSRPVLERLINEALGELPTGELIASGDKQPNQFVLVIDEINRANMSKVFGELITLIEPDKRLGGENELTVTLPYSGKSFGVPANLHILGTMNTADRSIALLDTALRRRFEFRELMPDPSVLMDTSDGIPLADLLRRINERIEFFFDREHQIGHAYFIGCTTRSDVDRVMRRKVIPLLAEYFYEDWSRIAAVLGDNDGSRFLEKTELRAPPGFEAEASEPRISWKIRETFALNAYESFR